MITPAFKLTQNNEFLFINIKTPFVKLNDIDIFIDETDFRFYCKPYFLRLNLPASILENDEEINYDFEENLFKLKYMKKKPGENFEGLDLLTKLLTPNCAPQRLATNLIEEVNDQINDDENSSFPGNENYSNAENEEENDDEIQWYIDQKINNEDDSDIKLTSTHCQYGFAQTKSNVFSKLNNEYELIIDLPDPDNNTENRTQLREDDENSRFDDDHYLADYFDDSEMIESAILKYKPFYYNTEDLDSMDYTEKEIETLKNLPKKKYLLDSEQKFHAYAGLIDILFAYCYNDRINCGEANVEAGWTIAKVSSTLSWLDTFKSLDQVLVSSFRRSLCIPLYRNWKISQQVLSDLLFILKQGHRLILKCLLDVRKTFIDGDSRYILNDLYINDYCVWIQYASNKKLNALVEFLEKTVVTKEMMNFDLEILELLAKEQALNENQSSESTESSESEESTSESSSEESEDEEKNSSVDNSIVSDFELKLNLESTVPKKKPLIEILD